MIELFSDPLILGLVLLGTVLGITVGAIPGLTGTMLIALSLPLTFSMEPVAGLVLLVAMYVGAVSGGLISATLLRMPGTPATVMTTLDGYPMAASGRPGRALGLGVGTTTPRFSDGFFPTRENFRLPRAVRTRPRNSWSKKSRTRMAPDPPSILPQTPNSSPE